MEDHKHLPRRPTKDKPLLKYCSTPPTPPPSILNTRNGPVALFTPTDLQLYKQQQQQQQQQQHQQQHHHHHHQHQQQQQPPQPPLVPSMPSSLYMASLMSPNGSSFSPFGNYLFVGGPGSPGGQGLTPGHILSSNVVTSNKVSNPYARPISAKDVAIPDQASVLQVKNTSLGLKASSNSSIGSTSSIRHPQEEKSSSAPVQSNGVIQTNSFMRPQSAFKSDNQVPRTDTKHQEHSVIHMHMDHHRPAEKGIPKPPPGVKPNRPPSGRKGLTTSPNVKTSIVQRPGVVRHESGNAAFFIKNESVASHRQNGHAGGGGTEAPSNLSGFAKIKSSSMHNVSTAASSTLNTAAATATSVSPASASSSRSSSAGSSRNNSTPQPLRNPHYTPTKPYSEIAKLSPNVITNIPSPPSSSPENEDNDTEEEEREPTVKEILSSSGSPTSSPQIIQPFIPVSSDQSGMKKMPVTNTLTGTIYYRKQSKAEEPIQQTKDGSRVRGRRAIGDGALAKVVAVEDSGNGPAEGAEEWEDCGEGEDDESTVPSERMPGDGEADMDSQQAEEDEEDCMLDDGVDEDDDEELIDNIYDDEGESDDNSDGYSLQSGPPSRHGSALRLKSATKRMLGLSLEDSTTTTSNARPTTGGKIRPVSARSTQAELQPALMPSLFPNVPPTINFVQEGEKVEQLPWEIRKLLKWKMSPITPNVVKNCIARSGFRATKRNHDWIGYWGKHMKAPGFKAIREYQKVNHFPGSFQIGRKDRLWRNLSKMQVQFGKKEYGFFPQTFVLPFDLKQLKRAWEDGGSKQKWIIKPPASARGIGIKVIHKWNQIPKRRPVIVQRYIARPLLINESKFDIRLYVYVTCYDPLRIYLYDDGLARFASCKYSNSLKSLNNRYMHLTNYSINKKNTEYQNNTDENVCQGHKWGLKALWGYMKKQGINSSAVWESMKDVIIKTIIASEPYVNPLMKANARRRYCCHELFGFDIMLDDTLKPWLIEVNISPSLHSNSQLDMNIKGGMIRDLLNIAGFQIPDKNDVREAPSAPTDAGRYKVPNEICMDRRLWSTQLAADERSKHAYYCQRHADEFIQQTILETMTPDDARLLVETIDEDSRRGTMQRIFPSQLSHKYMRFFEQPRYYNLLIDTWLQKYNRMEARGIAFLEGLCCKNIHLQHGTDDPKHQWSPPNLTMPSRDSRATSAPQPKPGFPPSSVLPKLKKNPRVGTISTVSMLPPPNH